MTLNYYLEHYGLRHDKFSERVGMTHVQLSRYLNGHSKLSLTSAIAILRETNGKITLEELADPKHQVIQQDTDASSTRAPRALSVHKGKGKGRGWE